MKYQKTDRAFFYSGKRGPLQDRTGKILPSGREIQLYRILLAEAEYCVLSWNKANSQILQTAI
jgi:hypothetical protein